MATENSSKNSEESHDRPDLNTNTGVSFAESDEEESSDDQDNGRALSSEEIRQLLAPLDERERESLGRVATRRFMSGGLQRGREL